MPFSPYDGDNHVVCEAWIAEWGKWIMLDPTYGGYVQDETGRVLSVIELRRTLADRAGLVFSDNFNYNGDRDLDLEAIKTYYAKDLFYLLCASLQGHNAGLPEFNEHIVIAPVGYDVRKSMLVNIDYRVSKSGDLDKFTAWRKSVEEATVVYKSLGVLYSE